MKSTLAIVWTMLSCTLYGQQLQFHGELVDTIFIRAHIGAYQFDDHGTTKGKADIISMAFDRNQGQYVIDRFYRDEYKRTTRPDTLQLETKVYRSEIGRSMDSSAIKDFLTSLSTQVASEDLFEQVDVTELNIYLTVRQIRKVAKLYDADWHFKRRYSSKEENTEFFQGCLSIDTLKIYFLERFDTSGYLVITDYANTIDIWITTERDKYSYEGKYPNPVRQPWYDHSDNSQTFGQAILNLNINQTLYQILPKEYLLRRSISSEALVNDYITWYLERREMKSLLSG